MSPSKYFIASKIRTFRRELEFLFGSNPNPYRLNSVQSEIYNICKGNYMNHSRLADIGNIDMMKWVVNAHKNPFNKLSDYKLIEDTEVLQHVIGTLISLNGGHPLSMQEQSDIIEIATKPNNEIKFHPKKEAHHNYEVRRFIIEYANRIRKTKTKKRNKYRNKWFNIVEFNPPSLMKDFELYFNLNKN